MTTRRNARGAGRTVLAVTVAVALVAGLTFTGVVAVGAPASSPWLGEDLPLPLTVKTPQDLAVKQVAERQYLIFNLLAGGKVAWDAGDFATAATKWEALLRLHPLDADIERVIRPLARDARAKAASAPASATSGAGPTDGAAAAATAAARTAAPGVEARPVASTVVSGTVTGGGTLGPGGAVVWLKRLGGEMPRPTPAKGKVVAQRNKSFVPRVLAVPVGSKVDFRNEDTIFHNVFSLSKPNEFDTGLYKQGGSYTQVFKKAGPVQLLCNIHSTMIGYVYVVDSPYFAQADAGGAFSIRNVPPGEYDIEVWHEASSKEARQRLTVGADGARG